MPRNPKLPDHQQMVLAALVDGVGAYCGHGYLSFAQLSARTGLDRKLVRRSCRALARKGLAEFGKGLFTEAGGFAGAGYAANDEGAAFIEGESTEGVVH